MIAVVQRVARGAVTVDGEVVGRVGRGFVVLLGVAKGDGANDADYLARRIHELRVFEDGAGKMNLALSDVGGGVLAISQFTLLAGLARGRRPDFIGAAPPEEGRRHFDEFVARLRARGVAVETGRFGASMQVELVNDGPATFVLDTRVLLRATDAASGPADALAPTPAS
ncbi:MAG: D-tyrosyl-tRNA(Tyr) deacylase [Planctomycetes bacterium]|nr:D-tyrosyl-tRNA(Tyr) deacylase [Planctomycetota bacterium]